MEITEKKKISPVLFKVIAVNVVNLVICMGILILLRQLPVKAQEVKTLSTEIQASEAAVDSAVLQSELEKNGEKINQITSTLSGDNTVISVISSLDEIKKSGVLTNYEFPVTAEISDKAGLKGLPLLITLTGTKQAISDTLIAVSKLKVFIRPVTFALTTNEVDSTVTVKYGGFLYTNF